MSKKERERESEIPAVSLYEICTLDHKSSCTSKTIFKAFPKLLLHLSPLKSHSAQPPASFFLSIEIGKTTKNYHRLQLSSTNPLHFYLKRIYFDSLIRTIGDGRQQRRRIINLTTSVLRKLNNIRFVSSLLFDMSMGLQKHAMSDEEKSMAKNLNQGDGSGASSGFAVISKALLVKLKQRAPHPPTLL